MCVCGPGFLELNFVDQAGLHLRDPPASVRSKGMCHHHWAKHTLLSFQANGNREPLDQHHLSIWRQSRLFGVLCLGAGK